MLLETKRQEPERLHLGYLDGVRGLAALYVVLFHLYNLHFGFLHGIIGYAVNWLNCAHLAVDVFIVLSGFCLALSVARSGRLKEGAFQFFCRRARRILPTYYAALFLSLTLDFIIKRFGHNHVIHGDSPFALHTILSNFFMLEEFWSETNTINPPFWSVALEWKIYFLFPVLVWIWKRLGLPLVLFFAACFGCGLTFVVSVLKPGNSLILVSPWYVILFTSGVCACLWFAGEKSAPEPKKIKLMGYAAVVSFGISSAILHRLPFFGSPTQTPAAKMGFGWWLPLTDVSVGVFACSILCLMMHISRTHIVYKILNSRPLTFIGTFSYSLYLIHIPVLEFIRGVISHLLGTGHSPLQLWEATAVFGLPTTLAASYLFHLAFERPFMSKPAPKTEQEAEAVAISAPAP